MIRERPWSQLLAARGCIRAKSDRSTWPEPQRFVPKIRNPVRGRGDVVWPENLPGFFRNYENIVRYKYELSIRFIQRDIPNNLNGKRRIQTLLMIWIQPMTNLCTSAFKTSYGSFLSPPQERIIIIQDCRLLHPKLEDQLERSLGTSLRWEVFRGNCKSSNRSSLLVSSRRSTISICFYYVLVSVVMKFGNKHSVQKIY